MNHPLGKNPYIILSLPVNCTLEDIKVRYRALAKEYHPDIGGDPEIFIAISIAVDVLRDPIRRKLFDEQGIYMEESNESIRSTIIGKFTELVANWIEVTLQSSRDVNLSEFLETNTISAIQALNQQTINIDKMVAKLEKRRGEVTCDTDENIVLKVINRKLDELNGARQQAEREIYLVKMVAAECKKYSSKELQELYMNPDAQFRRVFGDIDVHTFTSSQSQFFRRENMY